MCNPILLANCQCWVLYEIHCSHNPCSPHSENNTKPAPPSRQPHRTIPSLTTVPFKLFPNSISEFLIFPLLANVFYFVPGFLLSALHNTYTATRYSPLKKNSRDRRTFRIFHPFRDYRVSMDSSKEEIVLPHWDTPQDDPENTQPQGSWRSLFAFTTRKHAGALALALPASLLAATVKPASAILTGKIFSVIVETGAGTLTPQQYLDEIRVLAIGLIGLGGAGWLVEWAFFSMWIAFGELQAKAVREKMFKGLLDKEIEWYDTRENGIAALLIRIQTELRELQLAVSQPLAFVVYQIFACFAALGLAFFFSWQITLVAISIYPIVAVILKFVSAPLNPAIEAQKEQLSRASKYAGTAVVAINTVKAYNGQAHEVWQYASTIQKATASYLIQAHCNGLQYGILRFVMIFVFVESFWFGLYLVDKGTNPGHLVTAFYSVLTAMQCFEVILPQSLVLAKGMSAGKSLQDILAEIKETGKGSKSDGTFKLDYCKGNIDVREVTFAYPSNTEQLVLKKASFFFPQGETTFIVGKSGSGKSTLGNLLLKFYEPLEGEIFLDGRPLQALNAGWLRENITLVQQQSIVFNDTVRENIAFGKQHHATRQEILQGVYTADLDQTLDDLPHGLDTVVGSTGKALSGGQQQRVAIARARLRDAPVLILDEATSALDQKSREKVMTRIREWRKGKTTIIVTHDVSQIFDDEYVYVMEHGVVVQEGHRKKLADDMRGAFATFLKSTDNRVSVIPESPISNASNSALNPFDEETDEEFETENRWKLISNVFRTREKAEESQPTQGPSGSQNNRLSPPKQDDGKDWEMERSTKQPMILQPYLSPLSPPSGIFQAFTTPSQQNSTYNLPGAIRFKDPISRSESPRPPAPPLDHDLAQLQNQARKVYSLKPKEKAPKSRGKKPQQQAEAKPFIEIFKTVWPALNLKMRIYFVLGFVSSLIVAAWTPAFSYYFAKLQGTYWLATGRGRLALEYAMILFGIGVITGIFSYFMHYLLEASGEAWVSSLRAEALRRILAQPRAWFDQVENSASKLNASLDRNAEEMRNLVGRFVGPVFTFVWMLGITIGFAMIINWNYTLVTLACAPIAYTYSRTSSYVSNKWETRCNILADKASNICTETFPNIRLVRALTLEKYFQTKHTKIALTTYKTGLKRAFWTGLMFGFLNALMYLICAALIYYGGVLVERNKIDVLSMFAVINILYFGIANSLYITSMIPQIESARATATHILHLANLPLDNLHSGTKELSTPFPIQFNNLNFTYPTNTTTRTLSNINLTIQPSTITAIVGSSGSGKSTLTSILLGFYPPDAPTAINDPPPLTFNSHPIEDLNITSLRNHISLVSQNIHTSIFPGTIYENITYGLPPLSPSTSPHEVELAASSAGIHTFITSLPSSYSTLIGEGGQGLSGGQIQRIVIARALVRKSKLLVMDEATSALDAVAKEGIIDVIRGVVERGRDRVRWLGKGGEGAGTSVVVVTHDREMMRGADEVVVVEQGRIVERGGFEELRGRGGAFTRLLGVGG